MSFVSASTPSRKLTGPSKPASKAVRSSLELPPNPEEQQRLRDQFYNATIIDRIDLTEDLSKFRIRPDVPLPPFEPGQYLAIGLGNWEPRLSGTQTQEVPVNKTRKIARRAYSISCPMLHADETLATQECVDYLEFYITLVRHGENAASKPPVLTPRLFCKSTGDRLVMERKVTGKYVLGSYEPDDTMLFLGTGTGEAPHNAMAAKLLATGHRGRIVIATSVRYRRDCAYRREHEILMQQYPNYLYLPLTTREEENILADHPHFVGKQYLQSLFTSGKLAELARDPLSPGNTHVFLCGNPAMIGYVPPGADAPENPGMLPLLRAAGFHYDVHEHQAGTIRFEKYW